MTVEERLANLEARMVALQAIVGALLAAVERHCEVEITMGDEDDR